MGCGSSCLRYSPGHCVVNRLGSGGVSVPVWTLMGSGSRILPIAKG